MRSIIVHCDRCGKEMSEFNNDDITMSLTHKRKYRFRIECADLCRECMILIVTLFNNLES